MVLQSQRQGSVEYRNLFSAGILSQKCLPIMKRVKFQKCRSREVKQVDALQPETTCSPSAVDGLGHSMLHGGRTHTRGKHQHFSKKKSEKEPFTGLGLQLGNLGEGPEKLGFVLDWTLLESREDSLPDHLGSSYLEVGQTKARIELKTGKN